METTPRPATPAEVRAIGLEHRQNVQRNWAAYTDGRWWLVYEGPPDESEESRRRAHTRIRIGARRWAARNRWVSESRRRENGRLVWVRFTRP